MFHVRTKAVATALALVTSSFPAYADVTSRQVWDRWTALYKTMGATLVAGNDVVTDGTLLLTDVALSSGGGGNRIDATIPQIALREAPDGTVEITMSPAYDVRLSLEQQGAAPLTFTMSLAIEDLRTVVAGSPEAMTFDVSVPRYGITINDLPIESGMPLNGSMGKIDMRLSAENATARYEILGAPEQEDGQFNYSIQSDSMALALEMLPPDDPDVRVTVDLGYARPIAQVSGALSAMAGLMDMNSGGFSGTGSQIGSLMRGPGLLRVHVSDPVEGAFTFESASGAGTLDYERDGASIEYRARTEDLTMEVSGDNVPFPDLTAQLNGFGYGAQLPLKPTDEPRDIGFNLNLEGLTISETLWGLFDPEGKLPRDPATLLVDLAGKARALVDLTDPAAFESAPADQVPGELYELDLNALNLSFGGATLNGSGDFTFDNSDLVTFDGLPAAEGSMTFELRGGMGLLDTLVELGMVAQDQAMGARFMMGLFAVSNGEDSLTSTIDVSPDGSISANGQRLK